MRAFLSLAMCGTILLQSGCQSEPVAQKASVAPSPVDAFYRSLSEAVSQCEDASKKYADAAYRVHTKVASKEQGYAAAADKSRICNRSAESMLKLGANRLPNDVENAAFSTATELCASAALEKSSGRDVVETSLGALKINVFPVASGRNIASDAPGSTCATALANLAKIAGNASD